MTFKDISNSELWFYCISALSVLLFQNTVLSQFYPLQFFTLFKSYHLCETFEFISHKKQSMHMGYPATQVM